MRYDKTETRERVNHALRRLATWSSLSVAKPSPESVKVTRNQGYDVLINNLEPSLRKFIAEHMLLGNFGEDWRSQIPESVVNGLRARTGNPNILQSSTVAEFLENVYFINLKDIMVGLDNFRLCKPFVGELSKQRLTEAMNTLNQHRRKIAHAKSSFSVIDLDDLLSLTRLICQGELGKGVTQYLDNKAYTKATDVPADFFEEYECKNNLITENYDLDGGFVGRGKEISDVIKMINSDQDRILTITGAGGVGKTALALKIAYRFLRDSYNPFDCILWFSAKTTELTEKGILPLKPQISGAQELLTRILEVVDDRTAAKFKEAKVPYDSYRTYLASLFSTLKCLIIIDNLETIINNPELIDFVKNIPRPSRVLITSRKGLGEIERRYPISDLPEDDAALLFRLVSKQKGRSDLLALSDVRIKELVNRVRCYPLLIKWSIGRVCLGEELDRAFSEIFEGGSEIAKFAFEDVFNLFSDDSKSILYAMTLWGNSPISRHPLKQITNLDDTEFDDAIQELVVASFVYSENKEGPRGLITDYTTLTLTRGFVQTKLDQDEVKKNILQTRLYQWREQAKESEQAVSAYFQQTISYGLKTPEDYAAFTYIKAAKNAAFKRDWESAEHNYKLAIKTSPRLPYALIQYSYYELERGHDNNALDLAKRATESDPESYYAWLNLGATYLRIKRPDEAIAPLVKAKELNPSHLPIYNELGRAYSQCNQHEKAVAEFQAALKEEKYPNNRHRVMTLQFMAETYRRWAENFRERKDNQGQLEKLKQAFETISKAVEVPIADMKVWYVYRQVCIDYGIALWQLKGQSEGKPLLEKSLAVIPLGGTRSNAPDNKIIATANYFLAALSNNEPTKDKKQLAAYLGAGLAAAEPGMAQYDKLVSLKNQILGPNMEAGKRSFGTVRFYDLQRNFGAIESGSASYLFKEGNFRTPPNRIVLSTLKGKTVSFVLRKSTTGKQHHTPADIEIQR